MMKTTSVLLISMVFMASLSSISHALILGGLEIGAVQVTGVLRCTLNGNLNAPPCAGIPVHLVWDGTHIAQGVTNQAGAFTVTTGILGLVNFDINRCFIRVNLPVASCSVFPLNGVLTSSLGLVQVIKSTLGNVACLAISGPIRIGPIG